MKLRGMVIRGDFDVLTGELRTPYSSKGIPSLTVSIDKHSAPSLVLPRDVVDAQLQLTLSSGHAYAKEIKQLGIISNKIYYYNTSLDGQDKISVDLVSG